MTSIPKGFVFAFKICSSIDLYCKENAVLESLDHDVIFSKDDFLWNPFEKRQVTIDELRKELRSKPKQTIPDLQISATLVRVLTGAKAKRVKTKQTVTRVEENDEKSDFSESGEDENDADEDEEEFYEED